MGRTGNVKCLKTYTRSDTKQPYEAYGILFVLQNRKLRLSKMEHIVWDTKVTRGTRKT